MEPDQIDLMSPGLMVNYHSNDYGSAFGTSVSGGKFLETAGYHLIL